MGLSHTFLLLLAIFRLRAQDTYRVATFLYAPVSNDQGRSPRPTIEKNYQNFITFA